MELGFCQDYSIFTKPSWFLYLTRQIMRYCNIRKTSQMLESCLTLCIYVSHWILNFIEQAELIIFSMASTFLVLGLLLIIGLTGAQSIGVCNGRIGNNLPSPAEVVSLYQTNRIGKMRIYDPHPETLQALRGSDIELILDVPNDKLESLTAASAATTWVQNNIVAYSSDVKFKYIAVGNEVPPTDAQARFILPVMQNIQNALVAANLQNQIKVSTAIKSSLITNSSPPSNAVFTDPASSFIRPILDFLKANGAPLLANIYPYFSYTGTPQIDLAYALFTSPGVEVTDGQYQYQNLFDALLDSVYAALEKAGAPDLVIVVSESGWPSEGGNAATVANAETYYKNLIGHVDKGSPRRAGRAIDTYLFAMFDENMKDQGVEQHFGLFTPNRQPKYQISFG